MTLHLASSHVREAKNILIFLWSGSSVTESAERLPAPRSSLDQDGGGGQVAC